MPSVGPSTLLILVFARKSPKGFEVGGRSAD